MPGCFFLFFIWGNGERDRVDVFYNPTSNLGDSRQYDLTTRGEDTDCGTNRAGCDNTDTYGTPIQPQPPVTPHEISYPEEKGAGTTKKENRCQYGSYADAITTNACSAIVHHSMLNPVGSQLSCRWPCLHGHDSTTASRSGRSIISGKIARDRGKQSPMFVFLPKPLPYADAAGMTWLSLVGAVPLHPACAVMQFEAVVKMSKSSYGVCLCLCYNASALFLVSFLCVR
jgi:hypothetical protein